MHVLGDVVQNEWQRAFVSDVAKMRDQRLGRHLCPIVVRRHYEHGVGATVRRLARTPNRKARRFRAYPGDEPPLVRHDGSCPLQEAMPFMLLEERRLARGPGNDDAGQSGIEMGAHIRAKWDGREVPSGVIECRDDWSQNPAKYF